MKSDSEKRFYNKILVNIIYSLILTCILETFTVYNIIKLADYMAETQSQNEVILSIAHFETIVVLLFVLFGIFLFAVIFWLLQRKSLMYIDKLSRAMREISSGDLSINLDIEDDNEFSDMAVNINSMVEDIRVLMDKERESERTKNELITNIAHDLRTPLTSIIGYLELLSNNTKLTEDIRKQYTQIAYTKARKLEKLIEDLFGFTKLTYGKIVMKVDKVDVVKLMSQLMEEYYPNFAEKNLEFELKTDIPAAIITADGNLLARVFDNLINNAIKYGSDGKRIDVSIKSDGQIITVYIINYGKIIPADELPFIFNKFYRVEQSRSTSTGGTGLGLAIAKNIVEMHGGSIEVKSDLSGTAFIVRLRVDFDINKENFANA